MPWQKVLHARGSCSQPWSLVATYEPWKGSIGWDLIDIKNRGQVSQVDKRIEINNISIDSGSLIFADNDGVAIIPKKIEENFLKELSITVLEEKEIQNEINKGFSVEKILEKHTSF